MDYYLPGYKSGGPLRAIAGLTEALGDEFDFLILTSDRDIGERRPYPGVPRNQWVPLGKASVCYVDRRNIFAVLRRILTTPHDVLYMKSFFSRPFSMLAIWLRVLGLLKTSRIVVAPCGEFAPGALALKPERKRMYLQLARKLKVYAGAIWHATSEYEAADIRRQFGTNIRTVTARSLAAANGVRSNAAQGVQVFVASELPQLITASNLVSDTSRKIAGRLRAVFLGRIARNKNVLGALEYLNGLNGEVYFDIYGPLEDESYWQECRAVIAALPANIHVEYRGSISHDQVSRSLAGYDLFLFPTHGENFSYVILEALVSGCPILISDRTPWRNLQMESVGWDLSLDSPELFREALQSCVDMGPEEHRKLSEAARAYGVYHSEDPEVVARNRALFQTALERGEAEVVNFTEHTPVIPAGGKQ